MPKSSRSLGSRLWSTVLTSLTVGLLPVTSHAQTADRASNSTTTNPAAAPHEPVAPRVTGPQLLTQEQVPYPTAATGDAVVTLKLLITQEGAVTEAQVLDGPEPFASVAQQAAVSWTFEPARVDGVAKSAYINFQVEFIAPHEEPLPAPQESAIVAANPSEGSEEEAEVTVVGRRVPGTTRVIL